jgi:hypothetical protein
MPEFLENHNDVNFGLPIGDLGNVELPPWAPDPVTFVRLNREALGMFFCFVFLFFIFIFCISVFVRIKSL